MESHQIQCRIMACIPSYLMYSGVMNLTACSTHTATPCVSTFHEAVTAAWQMRAMFDHLHLLDRLGYEIAQYSVRISSDRCCASSGYAGYLMMAAWRYIEVMP